MKLALQIEAAAYTHTGKVRANNEDNFYLAGHFRRDTEVGLLKEEAALPPHTVLAAVCDGMGGESAGEVASLLAVEQLAPCTLAQIKAEALRQIRAANEKICAEIERHHGARMGSTLAALYIDQNQAVACNVGDSRIYRLQGGHMAQLTVDHSEAQRLVNMSVLTPEQARTSREKHRLTQHLGIFPDEFEIEPYFSELITLQPGDVFLLCSDGLTDMLTDAEIENILNKGLAANLLADALVSAALQHGGKDNITVVVLRVRATRNETVRRQQADNAVAPAVLPPQATVTTEPAATNFLYTCAGLGLVAVELGLLLLFCWLLPPFL